MTTTESTARQRFLENYRRIRHAEGRGSNESAYYRALPFEDLSKRSAAMWRMRAKTYRYFEKHILAPLERRTARPLDILDLGSGNCWLSYRLTLRKHRPVALDIFHDELDGLLAARRYPIPFPVVEAEFDKLPFAPGSADLAIFNASFHYSTDYVRTLSELRPCLRPNSSVVILDSPLYEKQEDGQRMVEERHAEFLKRYGFRSDAVPSIEFLDSTTLSSLSGALGIRWKVFRPWYGWQWHTRRYKAWLRGRRTPSRFWIFEGRFEA
jgi:SAM-dependent methyltransferase